jgi:ATP-dependent Clp protease ATP-binding subunit ClpC
MYERFTDRARKVLQFSNQEAQRFNHEYIGTEHILLGLVKEGSGVAAETLKRLGIDLRKVRLEVETIVQAGPDIVTLGKLPQTPRAKRAIELAINEAQTLNHNHVGTEHLLLGLLGEMKGVAAQILRNLGLSLDVVRREVLQRLGNPTEAPQGDEGEDPGPAMPHFQVAGKTDYNRLTAQVRQMIRVANDEATRLNHEFIAPEHMLLALVTTTSGVALEALECLGVDPRKVRLELESLLQMGPPYDAGESKRPTPQTKKILHYAFEEARNLKHSYVGPEHVLLGLMRDRGTTAEVLLNFFGLTLEKTRREIRRLVPPSSELERKVNPSEYLSHLPEDVKQTLTDIAAQIDRLNQEKEQAVAEQEFSRAANLRDQADKIKKLFGLRLEESRLKIRRLVPPCSEQEPKVNPSEDLSHLPEDVKQILTEMASDINRMNEEKEQAVAEQDFERASHLLHRADNVVRKRAEILRRELARASSERIPKINPSEVMSHLPEDVQQTLTEIAAQIEQLNQEKEQAVAEQDFERAAQLRDQVDEIRKIIRQGRKSVPPRSEEDAKNNPGEDMSHLPEHVQQTLTELAAQIDLLNREREQAVAEQDFERAAHLRHQSDDLKKQRLEILRQWRG